MAKVSPEARQKYFERINTYQQKIEESTRREDLLVQSLNENPNGGEYKKLRLAEDNLIIFSQYLFMNNLSLHLLGVKNEPFLNSARKVIYKILIYLEQVVSNYIDAPYTDYEAQINAIESFDAKSRLNLIRKLGLSIQLLSQAYGDNSKWRWSFVEVEGRFTVICKNFLNLKTLFQDMTPDHEHYETKFLHYNLAKKWMEHSANRYREKYELSTKQIVDFRTAIRFLEGLRKIYVYMNRSNEADATKRKIDSWTQKLEYDEKKKEHPHHG